MNNSKKNLLIIIPSLVAGGAEKVVSNLSFPLSKKYNITFVLFSKNYLTIDFEYSGKVVYLNTMPSSNPFSKAVNFIHRIIRLSLIKREENAHVSLSFLEVTNFLNVLSIGKDKRIISKRGYSETIGSEETGFYNKLYLKLTSLFYNKSTCVVTPTVAIKEKLIRDHFVKPEKIKVIYNSFNFEVNDIKAQEPLEPALQKFIETNKVIINLGRLTKYKGQWHLLRIFHQLKIKDPTLKLIIIGYGDHETYLLKLASDLGLKVFFQKSEVIEEDLSQYDVVMGKRMNPYNLLPKATLFVFPSLVEGFPSALVEAMACGLPILSSDCLSGPKEILAPSFDLNYEVKELTFADFGLLLPVLEGIKWGADEPISPIEMLWIDAISLMLKDEALRTKYASLAVKRANDFKLPDITDKWIKLIDSCL